MRRSCRDLASVRNFLHALVSLLPSDDLALIVRAINQCCRIHETDAPEMTEERLKAHMTLFAVRPGNCMVALERQQPVAAIISTRREAGAWIQTLGCQPAFQRRGIASQLVEALVRKIAIQRTEDITVDVPEDSDAALNFFQTVGFEERGALVTLAGEPEGASDPSGEIVEAPATELLDSYEAFHAVPACWERSADSLAGYGELIQGYAYRESGAMQGYLLHQDSTILDLACAPETDAARVCAVSAGPPACRRRVTGYVSQAECGRPAARHSAAAEPEARAQLSSHGAEAVVRRFEMTRIRPKE